MRFSREIESCVVVEASDSVLPDRGSLHPAFTEMLFLWGTLHEASELFRRVILPAGFSLSVINEDRTDIRDRDGYSRAIVLTPRDGVNVPSISPIKRFSIVVDVVDGMFIGMASDWGEIVYRTIALKIQDDALARARKWLDDNKPRWDSYTSSVNFERRPSR